MNNVPIRFREEVLLACNFCCLHEATLLTERWAAIAEMNIERRAILDVMVDSETGQGYVCGRQIRNTNNAIPFDSLDFRFVTNFQLLCTPRLESDYSTWSKVSLQQMQKMTSKRACKESELGLIGGLRSHNRISLCGLSEASPDSNRIAKSIFHSLPLTNRLHFGRIDGFERELGAFLQRLGPLYEVAVTGCTGITPRMVDILVDNFEIHPTLTEKFALETPMSDAQLVRLIDKLHASDECQCDCEVRLESETATTKELMEIYDFSAHFSHINYNDTNIVAHKGENAVMRLWVEMTRSIFWQWRTKY